MDKKEEAQIRNLYAAGGTTPFADVLDPVQRQQTLVLLFLLSKVVDVNRAGIDAAAVNRLYLQAVRDMSPQEKAKARMLAYKVFGFMDRLSFGETV